MNEYGKFIELEGQVMKRIFNPARMSKKGTEYKVHYIVIKWVTGQAGEYIDYVPIKTMEAKQIADIRAGNKVRLTMQYDCTNFGKELEYRNNTFGGVTSTEPRLFPQFKLSKNDIEIIDSNENWEQNETANTQFQQEVVNSTAPPPGEDDLPF